MRVSAYVRNASENLDKAREFDARGFIDRLYVQVHGNEPDLIAANREVFGAYQVSFGVHRVFAWFVGSEDAGEDAELVDDLRIDLSPRGWVPNDEKPVEGHDRTAMLDACMGSGFMTGMHPPDPIVVSTTGTPSATAMPYRDYMTHGAQVEIQAYDGSGVNLDAAGVAALVEDAFQVRKLVITAPGSPAWWVRLYLDNLLGSKGRIVKRWTWAQAVGFDRGTFVGADDDIGTLRLLESGNTWGTPARETPFGYELVGTPDDEEEISARTVFNRRTARQVGHVFGIAPYPQIRVALSVERAIEPAALADLVRHARVAGASIRGIGMYTLDNLTAAHLEAVAAVA